AGRTPTAENSDHVAGWVHRPARLFHAVAGLLRPAIFATYQQRANTGFRDPFGDHLSVAFGAVVCPCAYLGKAVCGTPGGSTGLEVPDQDGGGGPGALVRAGDFSFPVRLRIDESLH